MDIVLVPGLWLDGSTWDAVTPHLEAAGHRAHPLTLPGMESREADRSGVTLADHVAAVVAAIDTACDTAYAAGAGQVLLVGHSVGCGIAHAALDARPERVAGVVHVGGFPTPDAQQMLRGLEAVDGEVAMPDWVAIGEEEMVCDFTPGALAHFNAAAIPAPAGVLAGVQRLIDERRWAVPATMVCPEYTTELLQEWMEEQEPPVAEVSRIADVAGVTYVDLPGGHWPQLIQPEELARVILDAAERVDG